jgi:3-oxoacyl-[acyl-carrier protein] reductase
MKSTPFASFSVGQTFEWSHLVTEDDLRKFRELSGDDNPLHADAAFARALGYKDRVVHGALSVAFLSSLIGMKVPGPGAVWLSQNLRFESPVYVGDALIVRAKIKQKNEALRALALEIEIIKNGAVRAAAGEIVAAEPGGPRADSGTAALGEALVTLPATASGVPMRDAVALVTGGSRGIGAAISRALAARGMSVAINYHMNAEAAGALASELSKTGVRAEAIQADVSTPEGARALFEETLRRFGRVDVIVHNAHTGVEKKGLQDLAYADMTRQFSASVGAAAELARSAAPDMKARGFGRLIHIASSSTIGLPPSGWTAYVTAKAALLGLTRALASELAADGITCNAVSPALVPTDLWAGLTENQLRAMALRNPTRRLTSAADVAAAVAFLAGPEAGHINGANIPVTGGETIA